MELGIGDRVITKEPVVYGLGDVRRELPEGVIGEIVGGSTLKYKYKVVFDYPGFRDDYVYARLGMEISPAEEVPPPEVDMNALESILQGI